MGEIQRRCKGISPCIPWPQQLERRGAPGSPGAIVRGLHVVVPLVVARASYRTASALLARATRLLDQHHRVDGPWLLDHTGCWSYQV